MAIALGNMSSNNAYVQAGLSEDSGLLSAIAAILGDDSLSGKDTKKWAVRLKKMLKPAVTLVVGSKFVEEHVGSLDRVRQKVEWSWRTDDDKPNTSGSYDSASARVHVVVKH